MNNMFATYYDLSKHPSTWKKIIIVLCLVSSYSASLFATITDPLIPEYQSASALMSDTTSPPVSVPFTPNELSPWQTQNLSPTQIRNINILLIFDQWTYDEVLKKSVQPAFVFPDYQNLTILANYLKTINSALVTPLPAIPTLPDLTTYCVAQYKAQQNGKSFTKKTDYEALKNIVYSYQYEYVKQIKKCACTQAAKRNIPPELIIAMIENETVYYPNYLTEPGPSACVGLGQIRMGDNKNVLVPGVIGNLERFGYMADNVVNDSMLIDPFINIGLICQKLAFDYLGQTPSIPKTNKWSIALTSYGPVSGYVAATTNLADIVISRPYLMTNETIYFKGWALGYPKVTITAPLNNPTFTTISTITLTATASDIDGTISKVEFYNNTVLLGVSTKSPYSFTGTGLPIGTYSVTAKAYDNNNVVSTSAKVGFIIIGDTTKILITQTIALAQGWNLLSLNVYTADSSIVTVFSGLDVQEIKTMEGYWRKDQDVSFNSLHTIEAGKGYMVTMNTAGTLHVTGNAIINTNSLIVIKPGWNLIGCPFQTTTPFTTILSNVNCQRVKNFDGFWIPDGSLNSIQNFESGKGYFVKW
jgi:hypothetical protein